MPLDFKKLYKDQYTAKDTPSILVVPKANYLAVSGVGNPNETGGAYQTAVGLLYTVAYTLKMSYKTDYTIDGFAEYVVPPLEGFWYQEGVNGFDKTAKEKFHWTSVIRLPDFITEKDVAWAKITGGNKKKCDCGAVQFLTVDEGLCAQILHIGAFDDEVKTVQIMDAYLAEHGYANDLTNARLHHEIYMSDARKVPADKQKTIIRHPIKPI